MWEELVMEERQLICTHGFEYETAERFLIALKKDMSFYQDMTQRLELCESDFMQNFSRKLRQIYESLGNIRGDLGFLMIATKTKELIRNEEPENNITQQTH